MNLNEIPTPLTDKHCGNDVQECVFTDVSRDIERKLAVATRLIDIIAKQTLGDEDGAIQGAYENSDFQGAYEAIVADARETLAIITPKP